LCAAHPIAQNNSPRLPALATSAILSDQQNGDLDDSLKNRFRQDCPVRMNQSTQVREPAGGNQNIVQRFNRLWKA
jgi:hypothetical protein